MLRDLMKEDLIKGPLDIFFWRYCGNYTLWFSCQKFRFLFVEINRNMRCIEILQYFEVSYLNKKQYFKILHQRLYGISKI